MPTRAADYLHISTGTIIRFIAVLVAVAALYAIRDILFSLTFAVIIASAVEPAIEWMSLRRVPRILGVIILYLAGAVMFFFLVYLILPLLLEELHTFSVAYPRIEEEIRVGIAHAGAFPVFSLLGTNIEGIFAIPAQYVEELGGGFAAGASAAFGGLFSFLLVIVFSFYLAAQENGIEKFLRLITPLRHESYVLDLWDRSQRKLGRWLRTQMLLGAIVGVLIFFGLTILGIGNAFFFAVLAAIFEIIPVVGPILAAVPGVTAAFLVNPYLGLVATLFYVVIQQIESHVIVPVVMRRTVDLSPLIVVLALLAGGKLGGVFGILLAVPMTAILAELLNDWDKKKRSLMPE